MADGRDFDERIMKQIIGAADKTELRAEWTPEQLHSPTFSHQSASPPASTAQNSTGPSTFSSLLDCPLELESLRWPPSHKPAPRASRGLGAADDSGGLHHVRQHHFRKSVSKYYSYLKQRWYDH